MIHNMTVTELYYYIRSYYYVTRGSIVQPSTTKYTYVNIRKIYLSNWKKTDRKMCYKL